MPLLLPFLLVTLGLSLWLGFQAVDAARSHRRTAEGVLRDYADIARAEYSSRIQNRLDRFLREAFQEVPRRIRVEPPPSPAVMLRRVDNALTRVGCECIPFRNSARFLALDMYSSTVQSIPNSIPFGEKSRAASLVRTTWESSVADRIALRTVGPGQGLEYPSILFYNASLDRSGEEGMGRAIYILHTRLEDAAELFSTWYYEDGLLPEAVTHDLPNDSLLHLAVRTADGHPIFTSPVSNVDVVVTGDTLSAIYGGLVLEVGVRLDAASSLVIGGLPRARLPLLLALMVMTLGVGFAAFLQIRKEQELARVRADFVSGVSHEFRTPLTQIRMFTELLADGKLRTEEERIRSTDVINREARRLTHLVENILHFSQMERGPGARGAGERIEIQDTIGDLTEAFEPLVDDQEALLEIEVAPPDLAVVARRSALHRMLANLLDNALKYGPEGQTIRIRAGGVDGWGRISVEDQGPGIPPGERARIWDPYQRLERDVEGQVRGSGIGLAVVAELAEDAGGAVWVEDGRDGGARFVIRVPLAEGEDGVPTPERASEREG
jgi:signal transduction histidine kinase